jgi:hypothetical protein
MDTPTKDTKTWERADLQPEVDQAITDLCAKLNIETVGPPSSPAFDHGRRLARCLIRAGVRMCLKLGCPPEGLLPVLIECAGKEAQAHLEVTQFGNGAHGPTAQA